MSLRFSQHKSIQSSSGEELLTVLSLTGVFPSGGVELTFKGIEQNHIFLNLMKENKNKHNPQHSAIYLSRSELENSDNIMKC